MRLVKLGRRWVINLDAKPTGLETKIRLVGDDAEKFLAALEAYVDPHPWVPVHVGRAHPRGPWWHERNRDIPPNSS